MEDLEVKKLAENHPELSNLLTEHKKLNRRVDALNRRRVCTPSEEMERKQLSKKKLASKDSIMKLVARLKANAG